MYKKIDAYIEKLLNSSTPEAPIWNIESIRQGKKPHWNYIDGCMITSLLEIGRISGNPKYFDFAEDEWQKAIEVSVPAKFLEMNKKAFLLGYES